MGDIRCALGRAVEVVLHQECAERVRQEIDLAPMGDRLHMGDQLVHLSEELLLLRLN